MIVESNSRMAIILFLAKLGFKENNVIEDIRHLTNDLKDIEFFHWNKRINRLADKQAKEAHVVIPKFAY